MTKLIILLHQFVNKIIKLQVKEIFYIIIGSSAVIKVFSFKFLVFTYLNISCTVFISRFQKNVIAYLSFFLILITLHFMPLKKRLPIIFESNNSDLMEAYIGWLNAKCLSFCLDIGHSRARFLPLFAYCLYLPSMFTGPIHCYSNFENVS